MLALLFRVPSLRIPPPILSEEASCLGFVPLRDTTRTRPLAARVSKSSLRSVLRRSQPLDVLLRAPARRLISSRSHVQGSSRSGASLSPQPPFLVGRSSPLVVGHPPLTSRSRCPRRASSTPRSFSASSSVPFVRRLASRPVAPLIEFLLLQVSPARLRPQLTRGAPLMKLRTFPSLARSSRSTFFSVYRRTISVHPSPNRPTCPRISNLLRTLPPCGLWLLVRLPARSTVRDRKSVV